MSEKNLENNVNNEKNNHYEFKAIDALPIAGLITYSLRTMNVPKQKRDPIEAITGAVMLTGYNATLSLAWYLL